MASYTRMMKRLIVVMAGFLLAAVVVAGRAMVLWPSEPAGPVYTVADTIASLRQHPGQWVGRTVAAHGVAIGYGASIAGPGPALSWSGSILRDPIPLSGRRHNLALWIMEASLSQAAGRISVHFNAPGMTPTLVLRGDRPSRPTPFDVAQQLVTDMAARLGPARRTNTYSASQPPPRVYRVQLLAPARCPASLASPCYSAVVR